MSPAGARPKSNAAKRTSRARASAKAPVSRQSAGPIKPVRVPVSLPPELHVAFKRWTIDAAEATGTADVSMTAAFRAMARILTDANVLDSETRKIVSQLQASVIEMVLSER